MIESARIEEIIWVGLVAIGLLFALWAVRDSWGDYAIQRKMPGTARHKVARATLRRAVSYSVILLIALAIGIQALFTPPRPPDPASNAMRLFVPLGFISIMLILVGEIVMDRLTRREVLADLARAPASNVRLRRERDDALQIAVGLREDIVALRKVVVQLDDRLSTFQGGLDIAQDRVGDARDQLDEVLNNHESGEINA